MMAMRKTVGPEQTEFFDTVSVLTNALNWRKKGVQAQAE